MLWSNLKLLAKSDPQCCMTGMGRREGIRRLGGSTIPIHDPQNGPTEDGHLLRCLGGVRSYTYVEATSDGHMATGSVAICESSTSTKGVPGADSIKVPRTEIEKMREYRM